MASRFEVHPCDPLQEEDVIAPSFAWRFRGRDGDVKAISGKGFKDRDAARQAVRELREAVLLGGKRIVYPPIVDVNEAGDVIDPATGKVLV